MTEDQSAKPVRSDTSYLWQQPMTDENAADVIAGLIRDIASRMKWYPNLVLPNPKIDAALVELYRCWPLSKR